VKRFSIDASADAPTGIGEPGLPLASIARMRWQLTKDEAAARPFKLLWSRRWPRLPTVLVLASGRGARFCNFGRHGSQAQADLAGRPVLQHTLDSVRVILPWHLEDRHTGMGNSIAAAVRATADVKAG
jgi:hypothetical protein